MSHDFQGMQGLLELIREATEAGEIPWQKTREVQAEGYWSTKKGAFDLYRAEFHGFTIAMDYRVVGKKGKRFFSEPERNSFAVIIEKNGETLTLTDDPEVIPGIDVGPHAAWTCTVVYNAMREQDLAGSLARELARMMGTRRSSQAIG